jgi:hypothetical protein
MFENGRQQPFVLDYAITALLLALAIVWYSRGSRLRAPRDKFWLLLLAIFAPLIMMGGVLFGVQFGSLSITTYESQEAVLAFATLASLIGVPCALIPYFFSLRVELVHAPRELTIEAVANGGYLLSSVVGLAFLLTVALIAAGAYWLAIPSFVWFYLYACLSVLKGSTCTRTSRDEA